MWVQVLFPSRFSYTNFYALNIALILAMYVEKLVLFIQIKILLVRGSYKLRNSSLTTN